MSVLSFVAVNDEQHLAAVFHPFFVDVQNREHLRLWKGTSHYLIVGMLKLDSHFNLKFSSFYFIYLQCMCPNIPIAYAVVLESL